MALRCGFEPDGRRVGEAPSYSPGMPAVRDSEVLEAPHHEGEGGSFLADVVYQRPGLKDSAEGQ